MDNLQVHTYEKLNLRNFEAKNNNSIFIHGVLYCFVASENEINPDVCDEVVQVVMPPEIGNQIVKISYIPSWNCIFIATIAHLTTYTIAGGQFTTTPYQESNSSIVQTAWNPNQSILIVINAAGIISGYNYKPLLEFADDQQFRNFTTGSLHDVAPNSIYLGWGARNTQFKGSMRQEESKRAIPLPPSAPIVSWRGNGELFVVNYWKDSRRFLKVFDCNIVPLFESEPFNTLFAATTFKAQGNFIACAATDGTHNKIVVFEKNCQVKSSFFVVESRGLIIDVQYHGTQHVLAVHSQHFMNNFVNIYLYSNDVWYLKQQLLFPLRDEEDFLRFQWINEMHSTSFKFSILTSQTVYVYEYILDTFGLHNDLIGVINGPTVLFTDFSKIMPPPMSSHSITFERPVNTLVFYPAVNVYGFFLCDGRVIYYQYHGEKFHSYDGALLANEKSTLNTMSSYEKVCNGTLYKIYLNTHQELIVCGRKLASHILSVHMHDNYLLFISIYAESSKLFCMRFTPENISNFQMENTFSRNVEQGAKIICVTKQDDIILVMPRGNFETITSRLISIDTIEHLLSRDEWDAAVTQIKHQKLNWNLLIDLNMHRFNDHVSDFIAAAIRAKVLSIVVSEMSTENCLITLYEEWTKHGTILTTSVLYDDVKELTKADVFRSILNKLVQLNPVQHLISIVILQLKHYSVKATLKTILQVFASNDMVSTKAALAEVRRHREMAVIIKAAYTLYDLDFLKLVYSISPKDPKIYLPEIEKLRAMDEIDLRFTMSLQGREFKNATRYLIRSSTKSDSFVIDFIRKYGTQYAAYHDVVPNHERFELVTLLYADYLGMKAQHNEAGLILERAGLKAAALVRYKIGRNWRKVVSLLNALEMQAVKKKETLTSLAQDLANHKQFDDAALVYEHYCSDHKAAIQLLIEANMFERALCVAQKYNSNYLIETAIQPRLKKYREELYDRMMELDKNFKEYTARLLTLRKQKYEKLISSTSVNVFGFEFDDTDLQSDDNISEYASIVSASSMATSSSRNSRSSTISSRNRRKLERKKINLRPGSVYEDIALIRQLYLLAMDLPSLCQEIRAFSFSLVDDNYEFTKKLRDDFATIYFAVRDAIPRIWSNIFLHAEPSGDPADIAVIGNRDEMDKQFLTPPQLEKLSNWHW
ncbi:elongator complex protein 1 [Dendroctonus ponderosae]|uniref:Elongator complex protein 1 n=2 Tax=Dendroctonus ponderosae TaxID=77166 RepID=U4U3V5_DENPD|nr:elongator complex protein 1 [Dendroctonus ponderosae]ERL85276.1 hypothetical protein D910_02697 [Dendroctonus ponderosae]